MGSSTAMPAGEAVSAGGMSSTEWNVQPGVQGGEADANSAMNTMMSTLIKGLSEYGKSSSKGGSLQTPSAVSGGNAGTLNLPPLDFSKILAMFFAPQGKR